MGASTAEIRADSEEYRVRIATPTHVTSTSAPSKGLMPNNTPNAVATPFPPLKRAKTGKRCPRKTAIQTQAVPVSPTWNCGPRYEASQTASQPLAASAQQRQQGSQFVAAAQNIGGSRVSGTVRSGIGQSEKPLKPALKGMDPRR